ncbi:hypothetical protein D088_690068 [Salmonella enterica subsp. houtenae serovar 16:z4,z32:-- str. RKS3027]|nr:hypothetical protein D088_690068 [Salmonella enterica subsp. houtenae serovar 16:z4,z32:-- str. RKS3027]
MLKSGIAPIPICFVQGQILILQSGKRNLTCIVVKHRFF